MRTLHTSEASAGAASSTVWLFEKREPENKTRHAVVTMHHDGSGRISLHRDTYTAKVREVMSVGFDRAGAVALRDALNVFLRDG